MIIINFIINLFLYYILLSLCCLCCLKTLQLEDVFEGNLLLLLTIINYYYYWLSLSPSVPTSPTVHPEVSMGNSKAEEIKVGPVCPIVHFSKGNLLCFSSLVTSKYRTHAFGWLVFVHASARCVLPSCLNIVVALTSMCAGLPYMEILRHAPGLAPPPPNADNGVSLLWRGQKCYKKAQMCIIGPL